MRVMETGCLAEHRTPHQMSGGRTAQSRGSVGGSPLAADLCHRAV